MKPAALSMYRPLANARQRLVCFPHAGGGASAFRGLTASLAAAGIELCPLQPPGRENRYNTNPHRSAGDMAEEFLAALLTLPVMPTAFLGHSMGGLIAFLTTHLAEGRGNGQPDHLIASACTPPTRRRSQRHTHALPPYAFREKVFALGGVPEAIRADPALFEIFEPTLRADFRVVDNYTYDDGTIINCPVAVYAGLDDTDPARASLEDWQTVTSAPVRKRSFEGGHFYLYEQCENVVSALRDDLGWR